MRPDPLHAQSIQIIEIINSEQWDGGKGGILWNLNFYQRLNVATSKFVLRLHKCNFLLRQTEWTNMDNESNSLISSVGFTKCYSSHIPAGHFLPGGGSPVIQRWSVRMQLFPRYKVLAPKEDVRRGIYCVLGDYLVWCHKVDMVGGGLYLEQGLCWFSGSKNIHIITRTQRISTTTLYCSSDQCHSSAGGLNVGADWCEFQPWSHKRLDPVPAAEPSPAPWVGGLCPNHSHLSAAIMWTWLASEKTLSTASSYQAAYIIW